MPQAGNKRPNDGIGDEVSERAARKPKPDGAVGNTAPVPAELRPKESLPDETLSAFISLKLTGDAIRAILDTVEGRQVVGASSVPDFLKRPRVDDTIRCAATFLDASAAERARLTLAEALPAVIAFIVATAERPVSLVTHLRNQSRCDRVECTNWELLRNSEANDEGSQSSHWLPPGCLVLARKGETIPLYVKCKIGPFPYMVNAQLLAEVSEKANGRLIIVSGESGSGKTLGMLGLATHHMKSNLIMYFEARFFEGVMQRLRELKALHGEGSEEFRKARNSAVENLLPTTILTMLQQFSGWPKAVEVDTTQVVTVVIDEMGLFPPLLQALCCVHRAVAEKLREAFKVKNVEMICGGCGTEVAVRGPGTNPSDYYSLRVQSLSPVQWLSWLGSMCEPQTAPARDPLR